MRTVEHVSGHRPVWLRVVVAPGSGRVRLLPPLRFADGRELVERGQPVARLIQGSGEIDIVSPVSGRVSSVMALDGEPVVAGQPVMAIEPEAEPTS
jgi:multidrug efflux pump subunit AcrA (membrane-fusion protein)